MQVVEVTTTQDRKEYLVILENNSKFRASADVVLKYKIAPGLDLSREDIDKIKSSASEDRVFNALLRLITGRLKTEFEIRRYLRQKEISEKKSEYFIDRLKDLGLIDDSKYIESFVHDQNLRSPTSKTKLIFKLKSKGISKNIIEEYFVNRSEDQVDNLNRLIEIKRRQTKFKDDQKLMAYLIRNGFNYSEVKNALNQED
jgi:regulatory protein